MVIRSLIEAAVLLTVLYILFHPHIIKSINDYENKILQKLINWIWEA